MSYSDLLKDRRWQRKRLEVFNDANWKCRHCGSNDNSIPLHAHHSLYLPGHAPWEYSHGEIISLCNLCHAQEHGKRESDPEIQRIEHDIAEAHRRGEWDEVMRLAATAQELIDHGFYYKGLV